LRGALRLAAGSALTITATAVTAFSGLPAFAVNWASASNPLVAMDGNWSAAKGYGNYFNEDNIYARNSFYQLDPLPGGDSVYVSTTMQFYNEDQKTWDNRYGAESGRTNTQTWVSKYTHYQLQAAYSKTRGVINVCEDKSWASDPCSPTALPSFAY
jgi:hypothetical protein